MSDIRVVPLGAGQDVGRSCFIVSIGSKNIMFDCGMHMGFNDDRRFPDFSYITGEPAPNMEELRKANKIPNQLTAHIDAIIITHFHLDHCGALPYMSEMIGYNGPIYMTHPTKAIAPLLLEDFRKVAVDRKGEKNFFTSDMIKSTMRKVISVNLHETVCIEPGNKDFTLKCYYAGHVLGAGMFMVKNGSTSVLYTGDYNMTADRHLGAANIDICRPTLLISESTYATTIRDSKRCRERDFLKKVHQTVENGGKVLIPVFALGRAQELCILLEQFWERMSMNHVPMYFSMGLSEKATNFYKLFLTWTNEKIKQTFIQRNAFDFEHIKPFDRSFADNPGPMVVLATPGMLHAGLSLELFKKWCGSELNTIIMPGYCVAGTIGHKVLNGLKTIELRGGYKAQIKMNVEYMSFSAHADAKGIMQLIRTAQPKNVMLCHGEGEKMNFLAEKIKMELGLKCYKPANGETVTIPAEMELLVNCRKLLLDDIEKEYGPVRLTKSIGENITNRRRVIVPKNVGTLDKDDAYRASKKQKIINAALVIKNNEDMCIMSDKQACNEFKVARHVISLSASYTLVSEVLARIPDLLETALKRFSVVDYEQFLPTSPIESDPEKNTELYKSFHLKLSATHFNFTWFSSDDDFVDEFFILFDKCHRHCC